MAPRGREDKPEFPDDTEFLRVEIEGAWAAYEISSLLSDLSRFYDIPRARDLPPTEAREGGMWWSELSRVSASDISPPPPGLPGMTLVVVRIDYASPGFIDVAGVGKAVEQVRLFLQYLIDLAVNRSLRQLEVESREQDIIAKRLANAERLIGIAADLGLTPDERRALLIEVDDRQQRILDAVDGGRLTAVRIRRRPRPRRRPLE
jgi:hypothetical protein